jgi:hypothetical protein
LGVVEHFERASHTLREAYRVLKPGSIAIIETPLNNYLRRVLVNHVLDLAITIKKMMGKKYCFFEYRYSASELKNFVAGAGFNILSVTTKDYEQPNKSIGLSIDIPVFGQAKDDGFAINKLGQLAKFIFDRISPWICSACVVCVGQKAGIKNPWKGILSMDLLEQIISEKPGFHAGKPKSSVPLIRAKVSSIEQVFANWLLPG